MKRYPEWVKSTCRSCIMEVNGECRRELVVDPAKSNIRSTKGTYPTVKFKSVYLAACSHYTQAHDIIDDGTLVKTRDV